MKSFGVMLLLVMASFLMAESVAGVKWTAPAGWKSQGDRPMRAATYLIPAANGDTAGAECAVYFFGAGQGGSVEANLDRWKNQVTTPDGKPAAAKIAQRTIHGLAVATIDTSGDYSGMGGPTAASPSVAKNYRLLGAIIEAPSGRVFVKLAGPAKTVAAAHADFERMLGSLEKEK